MGDIIRIDLHSIDYEVAVNEISILVPKYLNSLNCLKNNSEVGKIEDALNNTVTYWNRLAFLFREVEKTENSIDVEGLIKNSLQSELLVLENVYIKVRNCIVGDRSRNCSITHKVLRRMDAILEQIGFSKEHDDRILMQQLLKS